MLSFSWSATGLPGDEVTYPDIDLELKAGPDGVKGFRHKDGTPYPRVTRD